MKKRIETLKKELADLRRKRSHENSVNDLVSIQGVSLKKDFLTAFSTVVIVRNFNPRVLLFNAGFPLKWVPQVPSYLISKFVAPVLTRKDPESMNIKTFEDFTQRL